LHVAGRHVVLAWNERDDAGTVVKIAHSADGGARWSAPVVAARTALAFDHPVLLGHGGRVCLGWWVEDRGWTLTAL
jgi:hypothetical protein